MPPPPAEVVALAVGCVALGFALGRSYYARRRLSSQFAIVQGPSAVVLRWATVKDAATILQMIQGLADFEQCAADVLMSEERLRRDFVDGHFECVLAESRATGGCVGFAVFYYKYATTRGKCLYLEDLYVEPGSRRCGVGLSLIRAVTHVAVSAECARVQWCAIDWNTKAIDFYKSQCVGARERVADSAGTKFVNFVLDGEGLAKLASVNVSTCRSL